MEGPRGGGGRASLKEFPKLRLLAEVHCQLGFPKLRLGTVREHSALEGTLCRLMCPYAHAMPSAYGHNRHCVA